MLIDRSHLSLKTGGTEPDSFLTEVTCPRERSVLHYIKRWNEPDDSSFSQNVLIMRKNSPFLEDLCIIVNFQ